MRKTSNKKHSRGGKVYFMFLSFIKKAKSKILFFFFFFIDDLIDNEQKSSYNKKVKSSGVLRFNIIL
jgi:hypothetical protein